MGTIVTYITLFILGFGKSIPFFFMYIISRQLRYKKMGCKPKKCNEIFLYGVYFSAMFILSLTVNGLLMGIGHGLEDEGDNIVNIIPFIGMYDMYAGIFRGKMKN